MTTTAGRPAAQPIIRGLIDGGRARNYGYWGSDIRSINDLAIKCGMSGDTLRRMLNGQSRIDGKTINLLITRLGFAARIGLQAPLYIENDKSTIPYNSARQWYQGFSDVAGVYDWACTECVPDTALADGCWFLVTQLRAGIPPGAGREVFDRHLATIVPCTHRKNRGPRLRPEFAVGRNPHQTLIATGRELKSPTLQSILIALWGTGLDSQSPKLHSWARKLDVSSQFLSQILWAQREFPPHLLNRILYSMDPIYHMVFEAIDQVAHYPPTASIQEAPDWYMRFAHLLHGLRSFREIGVMGEELPAFAKMYHSVRQYLHDGIPG